MTDNKLTYAQVKRAILASLTPDLLEPKWRALVSPDDPPESGHCAVATEAFYYLAGGRAAGFMPVVCGYDADDAGNMRFGAERGKHKGTHKDSMRATHRETHWWVRGPASGVRGKGRIFDVTAGQYPDPFPYQHGRNTGFMQPQQKPSKRAQTVMDRVAERLGRAALEAYKRENIHRFKTAQNVHAAPPHKKPSAAP